MAGLATGIGSGIAYLTRHTNKSFLAAALGFSAGVMIYTAFVELYRQAESLLTSSYGSVSGPALAAVSFFGGMLLIAGIDYLVPSYENPHHGALIEEMGKPGNNWHLERLGIMTAIAIGTHNFPEGIATFFAALTEPAVGISVAVAVALHNIPEGISISIPVYYATGSREKAFWYSFASGLSEPLGALVGYFALRPFLSDPVMGAIFAAVGGIMVFISLDQLIPSAKKYDEGHQSVYGLVGGMAVMAITLLLL
jgi:ZIP family zinc transporter